MYHHFILLHSDYSHGRRIAFHKCDTSIDGIKDFMYLMDGLKNNFPHLSFGFHHLQTEGKDWDSVKDYDMFFTDVFPVKDIDTFKRLIVVDDQVTALDIANLITSRINCTHLKLQKLIYFFYCEYTAKFKREPFTEDFLAWDYGPVVRSVYDKYKIYGRESIYEVEDNTQTIIKEEPFMLSVYSRFIKTPGYGMLLETLEDTLEQYKHYSANKLVELTHQPGTPWSKVFKDGEGRNQVISKKLIHEFSLQKNGAC